MATQSITTYEQLSKPAATPLVRQGIARRPSAPPSVRRLPHQAARKAALNQELMVEMLPMVKRMASKIREHLPAHVEVDDLVANGVLGLVDAVAKFDSRKQVKLESYARHRIRGSILDGLRTADPASRDLRCKSKKIQKLYRELELKFGRPVTDEEIASVLNLTLQQWYRTLNEIQTVGFDAGSRAVSAGPTFKSGSRRAEVAHVADDKADPFELCYRREQSEILGYALSHLRDRERQIISLYYQEEMTMKQIADQLNLDESRISQLHSAALARLKASVTTLLHRPQAGVGRFTRPCVSEVAAAV